MKIGERIRQLRQARDLSLGDLWFACKPHLTSISHISKIESGVNLPSLKMIARLAKGLGVSLSELFAGVDIKDLLK